MCGKHLFYAHIEIEAPAPKKPIPANREKNVGSIISTTKAITLKISQIKYDILILYPDIIKAGCIDRPYFILI
jgi:hypothetical protein